jgi:uncharacterized protein YbaR (Trm112 family)
MSTVPFQEILVCPLTRVPMREYALGQAESLIFGGVELVSREADGSRPLGRTPRVLVREDGGGAYPIVNGIPVLLVPEGQTIA